jgi:hypothetical protein
MSEQRRQQLKKLITDANTLINEYDTRLLVSGYPRESLKLEKDLESIRHRLENYEAELSSLGGFLPPPISDVVVKIRWLRHPLTWITFAVLMLAFGGLLILVPLVSSNHSTFTSGPVTEIINTRFESESGQPPLIENTFNKKENVIGYRGVPSPEAGQRFIPEEYNTTPAPFKDKTDHFLLLTGAKRDNKQPALKELEQIVAVWKDNDPNTFQFRVYLDELRIGVPPQ